MSNLAIQINVWPISLKTNQVLFNSYSIKLPFLNVDWYFIKRLSMANYVLWKQYILYDQLNSETCVQTWRVGICLPCILKHIQLQRNLYCHNHSHIPPRVHEPFISREFQNKSHNAVGKEDVSTARENWSTYSIDLTIVKVR